MKVLVVSGIWPPDVGGPASHAPEVAAFLRDRGHEVEVVITADREPHSEAYPVHWVSRSLPKGVVHARALAMITARTRTSEVLYTTGMFARSATACTLMRTPSVVKLTGDPAFERMRWRGTFTGGLEEFQRGGSGLESGALRALRSWTLRSATRIVCPSSYLREAVIGWGVPAERVSVLPNPVPSSAPVDRDAARARLGVDSQVLLAFAGRFGPQKALDVALDAVAAAENVTLALAGEGDGAAELRRRAEPLGDRVRFLGSLTRDGVLELFAAADASVLSSAWENLPHAVLESLAAGTPVLATAVGGVPEIVEDGVNGLLVPAGDREAFAAAVSRFAADASLRERLRAGAAASVERFAPEGIYAELEAILQSVAR
ncbi:MAG TPA: glycosyltransferase family 4 protein [Gaiellaceae bacterium]|jgi:glycosyltransferase involved in cell wall biosynthesis